MKGARRLVGLIAAASAVIAATALPVAAQPSAGQPAAIQSSTGRSAAALPHRGGSGDGFPTRSVTGFLALDGHGFDTNPHDYDIADRALATVLAEHPDSPLAALREGSEPLTVFLPNDGAYHRFVADSLGHRNSTEAAVFADLADSLSIDGLEALLLQPQVVPGRTLSYRGLQRADGTGLDTLSPFERTAIELDVRHRLLVRLKDADPDDRDPMIVRPNLNLGNRQAIHGTDAVFRIIDLP